MRDVLSIPPRLSRRAKGRHKTLSIGNLGHVEPANCLIVLGSPPPLPGPLACFSNLHDMDFPILPDKLHSGLGGRPISI